ncbi:MAG TPA: class I SAM-dependent methyltransferase [Pyrinomonadaceae bacterium]|nr:class I SAM-dependent methyltransferase [Pyrinomonadaceae bacterium]
MPGLNPLDHPVALQHPLRLTPSAWAAHIPFGMFLVDIVRPGLLVELGTYSGVSFSAFCQAVKGLGLETRCHAVDTWKGDNHSGYYGEETLADLKAHIETHYKGFAQLVESTFDQALDKFEDGTIDFLHIDGYHAYESVKHDFESWLPKMSVRGVVILHDTNVREPGFGVWKLWEELKATYPHFELIHEHGLGVVATGDEMPHGLRLLTETSPEEAAIWRKFFHQLGQQLRVRLDKETEIYLLTAQLEAHAHQLQVVSHELRNILNSRTWRSLSRYMWLKNFLLMSSTRLLQNFRRIRNDAQ